MKKLAALLFALMLIVPIAEARAHRSSGTRTRSSAGTRTRSSSEAPPQTNEACYDASEYDGRFGSGEPVNSLAAQPIAVQTRPLHGSAPDTRDIALQGNRRPWRLFEPIPPDMRIAPSHARCDGKVDVCTLVCC